MFYMPTHCTLGRHVAGVKLYPSSIPLFYLMLTICLTVRKEMKDVFFDILNFKFKSLAGWREFWRLSGTDVLVGGF